MSEAILAVVRTIMDAQPEHRASQVRHLRLYENDNFRPSDLLDARLSAPRRRGGRVTLNVVRSCVDTASSRIAKNRPRVLFQTTRGDFALQTKAKRLTTYMTGAFGLGGVYEEMPKVFRDAAIFGTGLLRLYLDPDEPAIRAERAVVDEIAIDDMEALYGKPRQIHQTRLIDRDQLRELARQWRDTERLPAEIEGAIAEGPAPLSRLSWRNQSRMLRVTESWRLPSAPNAKDGRHAIVIDGATLVAETYDKPWFPFVVFHWSPPLLGFWGTGLAEELYGIQREINRLLKDIQDGNRLTCNPRVFVPIGAKISKSSLSNEVGGIVEYDGVQPPVVVAGMGMAPEVYAQLDKLYARAYEITGISQSAATGRKPAGVDAAVAIREINDIETERFVLCAQRYEECFLEVARRIIEMSRDYYSAGGKDLRVKGRAKRFIESIDWTDVDLEDDRYEMDVFPASLLPSQPGGRLQRVSELIERGLVTKERGMGLLDFPDVEEAVSLDTAALDAARALVDRARRGEVVEPDEYMDVELLFRTAQASYLRAHADDAAPAERARLRSLLDELRGLMEPEPEEPAPPVDASLPGNAVPPPAPPEGAAVAVPGLPNPLMQ